MTFPHFGTNAVHAGQEPDPSTGAVIPAISLSTTFAQSAPGVHKGYEYSRSLNPTRKAFETAVAALEDAPYALAFASGSATTATIINLLPTGSHLISVNDVYGGTNRYFKRVASQNGVESTFVDMSTLEPLKAAWRPNTKLVWIETPTNPTLRLVDIQAVASWVHQQHPGTIVVVDNTFMSPYFQRPLDLGADVVVHSVTKYLNGHSDAVMGVAITRSSELHERLKFLQNAIGAVPSAFDCFLANRGLKTLHLRMEQHQRNALLISQALEKNKLITKVIYPGLPSHPQYELAKKQQKGFGGMISVYVHPSVNVNAFLNSLQYFTLAESLGGVESLIEVPSVMTHASVSAEQRAELGITDQLVRLSAGVEDGEDLLKDLEQALLKATSK